jgi:hypothetical protein
MKISSPLGCNTLLFVKWMIFRRNTSSSTLKVTAIYSSGKQSFLRTTRPYNPNTSILKNVMVHLAQNRYVLCKSKVLLHRMRDIEFQRCLGQDWQKGDHVTYTSSRKVRGKMMSATSLERTGEHDRASRDSGSVQHSQDQNPQFVMILIRQDFLHPHILSQD